MNIRFFKTLGRFAVIVAASASVLAAPPAANPTPAGVPPGHPPMGGAGGMGGGMGGMPSGHGSAATADMSKSDAPLNRKGKVLTVLDAKQFTYVELQDGKNKNWVVSPALTVKPGATVKYAAGEVMPKFHSKSLNRDFTNVMFTTRMVVEK